MANKNSAGDMGVSHSAASKSATELLRKGCEDIIPRSEPQSKQLSPRSQALFELLGRGRASSIPSSELQSGLGVDQRELRQIVRDARCEGMIICSGVDGYFLPTNREEVLKWYRTAHAKAISGLEPLKPARHYLELPEGQGNIAL